MADLTPDERAALFAALDKNQWNPEAIWRAARAFENEACAKVCDARAGQKDGWVSREAMEAKRLASAIRERAKGLA